MQKNHSYSLIEFCSKEDLPELQNFLNENWKQNHILAKNTRLMKWQHYNRKFERYNFIISRNKDTDLIQGILGYIPNMQFDHNIKVKEIFLAIWKVVNNMSEPMLGIKLLQYLSEKENPDSLFTIGLNSSVLPIYKRMGYKTGFLNHYYILNKRVDKFHLIGNFNGFYQNKNTNQDGRILKRIDYNDLIKHSDHFNKFYENNYRPKKTLSYIINKYHQNPFYDYWFYAILFNNDLMGIFIIRIIEHNQHKAIRLVEFVGLDYSIMNLGKEFQKLLIELDAEYLDFYNIGLNHEFLSSSGFLLRKNESEIIVPNYFEPFEKKNVNIAYAFDSDEDVNLLMFKGEGDQDRPSQIIENIKE